MRIYVAGKFSEKELIHNKIEYLTFLGHEITRDWTQDANESGSLEQLAKSALLDINAVGAADLLIVFLTDPKYAYRGTFTELGCALGLSKKVLIISTGGPDAYYRTNCFYHHPAIMHVLDWNSALQVVSIMQWVLSD